MSRRQVLKRAGIVAGAAWTVPLIQSAVAPAYAASVCADPRGCGSGANCSPCPNGTTCSPGGQNNSDCSSGYCRVNGTCGAKSGTGESCGGNSDCRNNRCVNGVCRPSYIGGPCSADPDCYFSNCSPSGVCGGAGATCGFFDYCTSGLTCSGGVCT